MSTFNPDLLNKIIIKQKTVDGYIEIAPITSHNAVVVDNENSVFLDTKLDVIDNHMNRNDVHLTMDNIIAELNKPVSINTNKTSSDLISSLYATNNHIFVGSTNIVESFSSMGTMKRSFTDNMTGNTLVHGISSSGDFNILISKGNVLIETSYYLTQSIKRLMFSDTTEYITAMSTYEIESSVIVAIGTNKGNIGIFKYNPGDSSAYVDSYAFTSIVEPTSTKTDVTNKLCSVYSDSSIDDIILTSNNIIICSNNSSKTIGRSSIYSYSISSNSITIDFIRSTDGSNGKFIGMDLVDRDNSFVMGFIDGTCLKYSMNNNTVVSFTYNQHRSSVNCVDIITDDDENIYLVYSDGILRKINSSDELLWDYQLLIPNAPAYVSIDKDNYYIVISDINGNFEIVSYMTGKNLVTSAETSLMMLRAQVLPGDYIEKIEVCQLNGEIELTGDIKGSVELTADNTCLIDSTNSDHTTHKIEIETTFADNIQLPISTTIDMPVNADEYSVVNKKYVDNIIPTVLSSSKPDESSLPTGGIWFETL